MAYDPTTNIGKVRLLIADTAEEIFTNAEIQAFLDMAGQNVAVAAVIAYGTIVRSRALLAKVIERDGYKTEAHAINQLKELITELKSNIPMEFLDFDLSDEHLISYRPDWRDLTDIVIE